MNNIEIRDLIKKTRLYNYEIAQEIGISEFTFCRWLRNELDEAKKQEVINAIKYLQSCKAAD